MNEIIFYRNKSGKEPVYEYLQELSRKKDKDSRVKLTKIFHEKYTKDPEAGN